MKYNEFIKQMTEHGTQTASKADNTPRGYSTVAVEDIKPGDKIIINNNIVEVEADEPKTAPTLAEIAQQRAENVQAIKALKEKEEETRARWEKMSDGERFAYIKQTPKEARIMREWDEIYKQIEKLEKIGYILRHNYRAIMAAQVVPAFVELLKKYGGKKAGEKTREKFAEELRTACGCSVWFERNFQSQASETAHICERLDGWRAGEEFTIYTKNRAKLVDEENTINGAMTAEDLRANGGEYIEDPAARVEAIAEAGKKAEEAKKAYNEAVEAFNGLIVAGYKRIDRIF